MWSIVSFLLLIFLIKPYTYFIPFSLQEKNKNNNSDDEDDGIIHYLDFMALTHSCNAVNSVWKIQKLVFWKEVTELLSLLRGHLSTTL